MRNKLLRIIFHGPRRAASDSGLHGPSVNSTFGQNATLGSELTGQDAGLRAFSALVPSPGNPPGSAQNGANSNTMLQIPELFGEVSKNLDQLRAVTETQTTLLGANTDALTSNTAAKSASQVLSSATSTASSFLGGLTALPIISGLFSLFGGGSNSAQQAPLTKYAAPPKVTFNEALQPGTNGGSTQNTGYDQFGNTRVPMPNVTSLPDYMSILANTQSGFPNNTNGSSSGAMNSSSTSMSSTNSNSANTHVTVNVQALDSKSFMDRSQDIAQAVREAMLNMHSINDVVNDL